MLLCGGLLLALAMTGHGAPGAGRALRLQDAVKIEEKVSYPGAPNCIRMRNAAAELILTTDYGPRILRYAPAGSAEEDNLFATIPGPNVLTPLGDWYIRGGHRLWHAPEARPRTYEPDNAPVQAKIEGSSVHLIQPIEKESHLQKEMTVTLDPNSTHVTVEHRLTNRGLFAVEISCWALTAMNRSGLAILPQEPYRTHDEELLPVRPLVLWSYTNMTDPRWTWGKTLFTLRQDPAIKEDQKIGVANRQGWCAYHRNGTLFLKRFAFDRERNYPDMGCNNEIYTNDLFLELETLGPLEKVAPGQSISHVEHWWLYPRVDLGSGEAGIVAALQPILTATAPRPREQNAGGSLQP